MYFKFSLRKHPESGKLAGYYRLVESYLNAENRVCHRTILNVGLMEDATPEQLNKIQKQLTERYEYKQPIFRQEDDPTVKRYVEQFWQRIVSSKKTRPCTSRKVVANGEHGYAPAQQCPGNRCGEHSPSDMGKTASHSATALPRVYPRAGHACRYTLHPN